MKDWYLIGTPSTTSGGFEDEALNSYKEDLMTDILNTELAVSVEECSPDLSERTEIKVIVQGNTADTYLRSMERTILAKIGTLKSGNYIYYEGEYWLINGRPGNNKVYEKAVIVLCQHYIRWQKEDGTIITRWANFTSASKYDVGEGGNYLMYLSSNNFTVLLPADEDAMTIEGRRIFIDVRPVPRRVFKVTRIDDVLYNHHEHGGVLAIIVDRSEFDEEHDNQELGICDYIAPVLPPEDPSVPGDVEVELHITHKGSNSIVAGGNAKVFSCYALASDGQDVDLRSLQWTVTALPENQDYISYEVVEPTAIKIKCGYSAEIIGTQILLTAKVYDETTSIYIEIGGGI